MTIACFICGMENKPMQKYEEPKTKETLHICGPCHDDIFEEAEE